MYIMEMQMKLLMKEIGVEPDSISLVSILSAAASLSALTKGKEIHGFIYTEGVIPKLLVQIQVQVSLNPT